MFGTSATLDWIPAESPHPLAGVPVVVVDLAANRLVDAILVGRINRHRRSRAATEFQRAGDRPRCRCGQCTACADNAKWDRVFQAKFADPEYYRPRPPRGGSSLGR